MASIVRDGLWTPPEGMSTAVRTGWLAFYNRAMEVYKVTPKQYRTLYLAQAGRCWICRTAKGIHPDDPKGGGSRRLGVDHNHATGQVRGLLCTGGDKTCNRVIGWLDAVQLRRAVAYLEGTSTPGLIMERGQAKGWPSDMIISAIREEMDLR